MLHTPADLLVFLAAQLGCTIGDVDIQLHTDPHKSGKGTLRKMFCMLGMLFLCRTSTARSTIAFRLIAETLWAISAAYFLHSIQTCYAKGLEQHAVQLQVAAN